MTTPQLKFHIESLNLHLEKLPNTNLKFTFKERDVEFPQGFDFELNKQDVNMLIADLNRYLDTFKD
jgi:hypothetical protein